MTAPVREEALLVNLTLPTTTIRLGPLAFDGVQALLGAKLDDVLAPLMRAARFQRPMPGGGVLDVFPLAIPDGEGMSIPVRLFGSIGFRNWQGMLVLIVPPAIAEMVLAQLTAEIASGQAAGPRFGKDGSGGIVAEFAVRLRPGMRKRVPLGTFGEFGVEAA